jgi:hypothetical protein
MSRWIVLPKSSPSWANRLVIKTSSYFRFILKKTFAISRRLQILCEESIECLELSSREMQCWSYLLWPGRNQRTSVSTRRKRNRKTLWAWLLLCGRNHSWSTLPKRDLQVRWQILNFVKWNLFLLAGTIILGRIVAKIILHCSACVFFRVRKHIILLQK